MDTKRDTDVHCPHIDRTPEETEALIARLNRDLDARMMNREKATDSVKTLRQIRAARTRLLRQRHTKTT